MNPVAVIIAGLAVIGLALAASLVLEAVLDITGRDGRLDTTTYRKETH